MNGILREVEREVESLREVERKVERVVEGGRWRFREVHLTLR